MKRTGFTLAEVLITLGIIGIVAAMTIPTLMNKTQNAQYSSMLKKQYMISLSVLKELAAENGSPDDLVAAGLFNTEADADKTTGLIAAKYKLSKDCIWASGCWPSKTSQNFLGGTFDDTGYDSLGNYRKFITADGSAYAIDAYSGNCNVDTGSGRLDKTCGILAVDVNGLKGPNRWGRDIFAFFITNLNGISLHPYGGQGAVNTWNEAGGGVWACGIGTSTHGVFCAGRVMEEGWQMNY